MTENEGNELVRELSMILTTQARDLFEKTLNGKPLKPTDVIATVKSVLASVQATILWDLNKICNDQLVLDNIVDSIAEDIKKVYNNPPEYMYDLSKETH